MGKIKIYTCKTGYEFKTAIPTNSGSEGKEKMVFNFNRFTSFTDSDPVLTSEIKATCTSSASDVPKWIFDYSLPTSCESN